MDGFFGLRLGRAAGGSATVTITDGGKLDVGNARYSTIEQTGELNVSGAAFITSGDFDVLAGTVNLNDGSVQQSGTAAVNIGTSGTADVDILLGSRITTGAGGLHVGAGGEIDVVGVVTDRSFIFANGPVTVDGGSLTVGNFGEFTMLGDDYTLVASNDAPGRFRLRSGNPLRA